MVRWYWGPTGTGKSRTAHTEAHEGEDPDVYRASGPAVRGGRWWWDGYDAHARVIIDDFRPVWCGIEFLLHILDRYGCRIECKGGSRQMLASEIWITCPKHPEACYEDEGEDMRQLLRRITVIKQFEVAL